MSELLHGLLDQIPGSDRHQQDHEKGMKIYTVKIIITDIYMFVNQKNDFFDKSLQYVTLVWAFFKKKYILMIFEIFYPVF